MSKYTRGKLAQLFIAPVVAATPDVEPLVADRKFLCATSSIKLGFGSRTLDFQNFCTGGATVKIPVGKDPRMEIGEAQWTDDDVSLQIMEESARNDAEVWYWYYPKGLAGNKGYKGKMNVSEWDMTSPSDGLTTVTHGLEPIGLATPFGFPHLSDNESSDAPISGGALTSGTAKPNLSGATGSVTQYTITLATTGKITATTSGGTGNVTLRVRNSAGTILGFSNTAANAESVVIDPAAAGNYTVELLAASAYTGVTLTVTVS